MYAVENLLIFDKFTIICDPDLYLKEYQEEQAEPAWQQEQSGLTDEELVIAQDELQKIAAKIQATVTSTD